MPKQQIFSLIIRLPLAVGMILLNLVLMLAGFLLIAVAPAAFTYVINYDTYRLDWQWRWMQAIYGNNEDGINGLFLRNKNINWLVATATWSAFRRRWVWSAWRNSVNNLRYTKLFASPSSFVEPPKGSFAFMTSGFKFWLQAPLGSASPWYVLWLGWKPQQNGIPSAFKATVTSLAKVGA